MLEELANAGKLTEAQSQRFLDLIFGDFEISQMSYACLHWWQRPFARWLLEDPSGVVKRRAKVRKMSAKWNGWRGDFGPPYPR